MWLLLSRVVSSNREDPDPVVGGARQPSADSADPSTPRRREPTTVGAAKAS